jgi:hypothetical protein
MVSMIAGNGHENPPPKRMRVRRQYDPGAPRENLSTSQFQCDDATPGSIPPRNGTSSPQTGRGVPSLNPHHPPSSLSRHPKSARELRTCKEGGIESWDGGPSAQLTTFLALPMLAETLIAELRLMTA